VYSVVGFPGRELDCGGAEVDAREPDRQRAGKPETRPAATAPEVGQPRAGTQAQCRHRVPEQPPRAGTGGLDLGWIIVAHRPRPQLVEQPALLRRVMHRVVVVGLRTNRPGLRHKAILVDECDAPRSAAGVTPSGLGVVERSPQPTIDLGSAPEPALAA
jgi:hypothetical protein